jgi:hypothetical protein
LHNVAKQQGEQKRCSRTGRDMLVGDASLLTAFNRQAQLRKKVVIKGNHRLTDAGIGLSLAPAKQSDGSQVVSISHGKSVNRGGEFLQQSRQAVTVICP